MNILIVAAHGLYADYGASFVHSQAKEYVKAGHRVRAIIPVAAGKRGCDVVRLSAPIVRAVRDGVEIFYLRYLSLGHVGENGFNPASAQLAVRMTMSALLRGFTPDVIHAHAILFAGRIAADIKRRCPDAPLVITTHGGDTDLALTAAEQERARRICTAADHVVAVSGVYEEKTRHIGADVPISCILNGFNVQNVRVAVKKKHSIIHVSYLIARKHAELSIKALARVRKTYPDAALTIIGHGVERERLERVRDELGLGESVRFTGFLPNEDTMGAMAQSEIFVLPSVDEGFGIVYIEAMASGCITIGTEGEGISSVIRSGENGFLVPPLDADAIAEVIERCFADPEYAALIAARGTESAKTLTWERNARQYIELFEKLIGGSEA